MGPTTYSLSEADIVAGNDLWRRHSVKPWVLLIAFAAICALAVAIMPIVGMPLEMSTATLLPIAVLLGMAAIYLVGKQSSQRIALRYFRQTRSIQQEITMSWTDTHLALKQPDGYQDRPWGDTKSWAEDDTVLALFSAGPIFTAIPKRALTAEQWDDVRACLVRAGVKKARLAPF